MHGKKLVCTMQISMPRAEVQRLLDASHHLGMHSSQFMLEAVFTRVREVEAAHGGPLPTAPPRANSRAVCRNAVATVPATTGHRRPKLAQDDSAGRRLAIQLGHIIPANCGITVNGKPVPAPAAWIEEGGPVS